MAKRLGIWLSTVPVGLRRRIGVAGGRSEDEGVEDSFGRSVHASPIILAISHIFEVIWNDIDLYHAYRDFTTDPIRYPAEDLRALISELASVPTPSYWDLTDMCTIIDRKRTTLHPDCRCGDSRAN